MNALRARVGLCVVVAVLASCSSMQTAVPAANEQSSPSTTVPTTSVPSTVTVSPPTTLSELDQLREEQFREREQEVMAAHEAYAAYELALDERHGAAASELVTIETRDWFLESLRLAQTGTEVDLEEAPLHQFISAVRLRLLLDADVHSLDSGAQAFETLVDAGMAYRIEPSIDWVVRRDNYGGMWVHVDGQRSTWQLWSVGDEWQIHGQYAYNFLSFVDADGEVLELLTGARSRDEFLDAAETSAGRPLRAPPPVES